jgi:hypothetical protein
MVKHFFNSHSQELNAVSVFGILQIRTPAMPGLALRVCLVLKQNPTKKLPSRTNAGRGGCGVSLDYLNRTSFDVCTTGRFSPVII